MSLALPGEAPDSLGFASPVADSGYRWWYIDAMSNDGQYHLVIIAFIGSVFSPYYYRARAGGRTDPFDFCAINVCLYGVNANRWTMTERSKESVICERKRFSVGPSTLSWSNDCLEVQLEERSVPSLRRVSGCVRLYPEIINKQSFALDPNNRHYWMPILPRGRIEVDLQSPALSWQGHAYMDTNFGYRPLEKDFRGWHWSRSEERGAAHIAYDTFGNDGIKRQLAMSFDTADRLHRREPAPATSLPRTAWRLQRDANCRVRPQLLRTLEDTPFYARSLLTMESDDGPVQVMHESLSLQRFQTPWVRMLLPFRMPRVTRRRS
ncbi:MAG TPA: carotenoid 1,2-hydratase [Woeseiaceae bacterium]